MAGWGQSIYLKSEEAFFYRRRCIEHWQVKTEDEEEEKRVDFLNKHERRRGRKREDMASISSALRFVFLNSAAKVAERENRSENEGDGI